MSCSNSSKKPQRCFKLSVMLTLTTIKGEIFHRSVLKTQKHFRSPLTRRQDRRRSKGSKLLHRNSQEPTKSSSVCFNMSWGRGELWFDQAAAGSKPVVQFWLQAFRSHGYHNCSSSENLLLLSGPRPPELELRATAEQNVALQVDTLFLSD